ncbi:MAG: hypothetical protein ACLP36_13030, partial [Acidimicrobiales bacterium]
MQLYSIPVSARSWASAAAVGSSEMQLSFESPAWISPAGRPLDLEGGTVVVVVVVDVVVVEVVVVVVGGTVVVVGGTVVVVGGMVVVVGGTVVVVGGMVVVVGAIVVVVGSTVVVVGAIVVVVVVVGRLLAGGATVIGVGRRPFPEDRTTVIGVGRRLSAVDRRVLTGRVGATSGRVMAIEGRIVLVDRPATRAGRRLVVVRLARTNRPGTIVDALPTLAGERVALVGTLCKNATAERGAPLGARVVESARFCDCTRASDVAPDAPVRTRALTVATSATATARLPARARRRRIVAALWKYSSPWKGPRLPGPVAPVALGIDRLDCAPGRDLSLRFFPDATFDQDLPFPRM